MHEANPFQEIDDAIRSEDRKRREYAAGRLAALRLPDLPQLLRLLGGSVLIASALAFMVQNWSAGNDVVRYFHFLAFTAALSGVGFLCGLRMRDEKGARTFLGLAAAVVPAHFTVLGALLYSRFPWLSGLADYPDYATITAPSGAWALGTSAIGIGALAPIVWIAFRAFARPRARLLTLAYIGVNTILLIPTRNPDVIALFSLALLAGLPIFDRRVLHPVSAMRTREGGFVRCMLFAPLVVMVARSIHLYELTSLFAAGLLAILAAALFEGVPALTGKGELRAAAQWLAVVPALSSVTLACDAIVSATGVADAAQVPLFALSMAGVLALLSLRSVDGGASLRGLAALVASAGMVTNLIVHPGLPSSFTCLAVALCVVVHGFVVEQKSIFFLGLGSGAFALLYHLRFAIDLYAISPWLSLAVLGAATVVAGSLIERHQRELVLRATALRRRIAAWTF